MPITIDQQKIERAIKLAVRNQAKTLAEDLAAVAIADFRVQLQQALNNEIDAILNRELGL